MITFHTDLKFYKFIQAKVMNIPESDKFEDLNAKLEFKVVQKK